MATTTIHEEIRVGGVLTDPTSVVLSDSTGAWGVKRNDMAAPPASTAVVPDGTAMTKISTGVYEYTFTEPAYDLTYTYAVEIVLSGATYRWTDTITGTATPVAAGDLGLNFGNIYKEVSNYIGLGLSPTGTNATLVKKYANDGYRMFLGGVDPRTNRAHEWTFLYPDARLSLTGGTCATDLPSDFDSMVDDPVYGPGDGPGKLEPRPVSFIRRMRAAGGSTGASAGGSASALPMFYAVSPKSSGGSSGQAWQILVWPMGSTAYTMEYRYRARPRVLTSDSDFPKGGPQHQLTILQAALAVAEQRENDEIGTQTLRFKELMAASIDMDSANRPRNYGAMTDPSDNTGPIWDRRRTVTY